MTSPKSTRLLAKLRRYGATGAVAGVVAILAACAQTRPAPAAGDDPLVLSQSTGRALQQYLAKVDTYGGAFAVSPDGASSYYIYCPDVACSPPLYGGIAKSQCHSLSGQDCYLLYVRNQPRIAYTVANDKMATGHHGYRRAMPLNELPIFDD